MTSVPIKIDPKGSTPVTGTMNEGSAYHGDTGIGLHRNISNDKWTSFMNDNTNDSKHHFQAGI